MKKYLWKVWEKSPLLHERIGGTDRNDYFLASHEWSIYYGFGGYDTVDYSAATGAVQVDLTLGRGFGDIAHEDYYFDIEKVIGSRFADTFKGDDKDNVFDGGSGNDVFIATRGSDIYVGARGSDAVDYSQFSSSISVDMTKAENQVTKVGYSKFSYEYDTLVIVEEIRGTEFGDWFVGSERSHKFYGNGGNDYYVGSSGFDLFHGGEGFDTADYSQLEGDIWADLSWGVVHKDPADGSGGRHTDHIDGAELLIGTDFDDSFKGNDENNEFRGGNGNDLFKGTDGIDTFDGQRGFDTADYSDFDGHISVDLEEGNVLKTGYFSSDARSEDQLRNVERVFGTENEDTFVGNARDNEFHGGGGNDRFFQSAGQDVLLGGAGNDMFIANEGAGGTDYVGGAGSDVFIAEFDNILLDLYSGVHGGAGMAGNTFASIEAFVFSGDSNRLHGSSADEQLFVHGDNNTVEAGGGNDILSVIQDFETLSFGLDNRLDGGAGIDTIAADFEIFGGSLSVGVFALQGVDIDLAEGEMRWNIPEERADIVHFSNIENAIGSQFDDVFHDSVEDNLFTGGAGSDLFVFEYTDPGEQGLPGESDRITDFQAGVDRIDLSESEIDNWRDLNRISSDDDGMVQVGSDVVIYTTDSDVLTLGNVNINDLSQDDFIF